MSKGRTILSEFMQLYGCALRDIARQFWVPPHVMSDRIRCIMEMAPGKGSNGCDIVVSGETDNLSIYLLRDDDIIVYSPFCPTNRNIILRELSPHVLSEYCAELCLVRRDEPIVKRLCIPRVVLINPSIREVYPVPRLALCVGSLAAYLRKYQRAHVWILDMQSYGSVGSIVDAVKEVSPSVIGISISFGQLGMAEEIVNRILAESNIVSNCPVIIAGNALASLGRTGFLKKFNDSVIACGEGEKTMVGIIDMVEGKRSLFDVPGIAYLKAGEMVSTSTVELDMDDIPLPSMDTIEDILKNDGALTIELSRGCFHSACTFCPRTHKPKTWKGMSPEHAIEQLDRIRLIFDHFGGEKRIFMADEEYIGWQAQGNEANRINMISEGIIQRGLGIKYETNARIDQIYSSSNSRPWHVERMSMLSLCGRSGLERLLVGVESGSDSVLKRFNKNISTHDTVMAIRILSSLGIGVRMTFITFDPLMSFFELRENIAFLERGDVFLKCLNKQGIDYSEVLDNIDDPSYVSMCSQNRPFYENVSYMVVSMEVLVDAKYYDLMEGNLIIGSDPDYNMAKYKTLYRDPIIGEIALHCQKWIDRNYALDYCLKGFQKVAKGIQRDMLFEYRARYRKLSFVLLRVLTWIVDTERSGQYVSHCEEDSDWSAWVSRVRNEIGSAGISRADAFEVVMEMCVHKMQSVVDEIEGAVLNGEIADCNNKLRTVMSHWRENSSWGLING